MPFLVNALHMGDRLQLNDSQWKSLQNCTRDALIYGCLDEQDDDDSSVISGDSVTSHHVDVPTFDGEPEDIAAVLDYILVRWPDPPGEMIRTRQGRSILRRYANKALSLLTGCLSRYDHDYFRVMLRVMWNRRAQLYFDSSSPYLYIPYYLSIDEMDSKRNLYTYDDPWIWPNFTTEDWNYRNPPAKPSELGKIFNIHILSHSDSSEYDIIALYHHNGMRRADCFIENQIDQFYRILFFFLELEARGMRTDEDDVYNGRLTHEVLPATIHGIVESDFGYRTYLLERRQYQIRRGDNAENVIRRSLAKSGRVKEENLIWLMMNLHVDGQISTTTPSTTTRNVTTMRSVSTTSHLGKRKKGTM